jgi:diguanylate cyclase (GGDEF)-like protein
VLRVGVPRVATQFARVSFTQTAIGMGILAIVMIIAIASVTDNMVLKRLGLLGRQVAAIGDSRDPNARVQIGGKDEIAGVATGINQMLGQLEDSQSDLAYLASHDSLTRLHNRRRFESDLRLQLARRGHGALLWLDVDHFKEVNDALGHAVGDDLLIALANLLAQHTRGSGHVARLGGDEFGILLPRASEAEAIAGAKRILDLTARNPFSVGEHEIRISVSIGIVLFPEHGSTIDDLVARADLAMYQAKSAGRNALSVFTSDAEWQSEMSERIAMAEQIVRALRDDQFMLYAQPLRRTADATTDTYELLLRMKGEDGSIIMPARIIPTAERVGLIRDIDRWVVRRGIALIAAEQRAGRDTRFAVNVSGTAFSDPELLRVIRDEIAQQGIDPSRLIIEITETTAIADIEGARQFITELRAIGCQFSLDDFGAGTSSFYYLKHLPIDYLKIDGSLVKSLGSNTTDEHFVRAIIEMCRGLEIPTVAEYVEDAAIYDIVTDLGVDFAQGYGVGHPKPLSGYFIPTPEPTAISIFAPTAHLETPAVWPPKPAQETA